MEAVLAEHYGIEGAPIVPLARGHTNASFAVGDRFVLRRSWAGKPLSRVEREERVLAAAGVPRIVKTTSGASRVHYGDRVIHLFERLPGDVGPAYLGRGDVTLVRSAMTELARVHRRLAELDDAPSGALRWLEERFDRVRAHGDARLLARIERVLADARAFDGAFDGAAQWLHGDYHLGNLLFVGDRVSAVVDFDDTGPGSALGEAVMALFALSRRDEGEERFVFDRESWNEGLRAYDPCAAIDPDAFVPLFCAYQVLVHLEAAQRGWWKLEPGIGFGPCRNALR